MKYRFWGWEHADTKAITAEYKGIETPVDLYDALSHVWCADTCAPRMRQNWTKENMTLGQCSITAFLAQDIFGGKVYGILRPGGNYHCYNVILPVSSSVMKYWTMRRILNSSGKCILRRKRSGCGTRS